MFEIAFDLATVDRLHPRKNRGAYRDIKNVLSLYGFNRIQGSTYVANHEDLGRLHLAIVALHRLEWFGASLKNIRVFRMEEGADFTSILQSPR